MAEIVGLISGLATLAGVAATGIRVSKSLLKVAREVGSAHDDIVAFATETIRKGQNNQRKSLERRLPYILIVRQLKPSQIKPAFMNGPQVQPTPRL
jgi:hypothetical protein